MVYVCACDYTIMCTKRTTMYNTIFTNEIYYPPMTPPTLSPGLKCLGGQSWRITSKWLTESMQREHHYIWNRIMSKICDKTLHNVLRFKMVFVYILYSLILTNRFWKCVFVKNKSHFMRINISTINNPFLLGKNTEKAEFAYIF